MMGWTGLTSCLLNHGSSGEQSSSRCRFSVCVCYAAMRPFVCAQDDAVQVGLLLPLDDVDGQAEPLGHRDELDHQVPLLPLLTLQLLHLFHHRFMLLFMYS